MEFRDVDSLVRKLSGLVGTDQTRRLTAFYVKARFDLPPEDFTRQYTDGGNDGGIDFYHTEDTTFFLIQTKFSGKPRKASSSEILDEIKKIRKTLTVENQNKKAEDFVNALRGQTGNRDAILEIIWLTTDMVEESVGREVQDYMFKWREEEGWSVGIDLVVIDKQALDGVIYDVAHGYVPYTGKRKLKCEDNQWIETIWEETGIYAVVCTVNSNHLLRWFKNSRDIDKFLQKNVRDFLGEKSKINKQIQESYIDSPDWFWYKHNGIIIFADSLYVDKANMELTMRNPQVVNGGQTLKSLFLAFNRNKKSDNSAKVLLRAYRMPYGDTQIYARSIEIIKALNTQNKILPSDLHSTDPRQVRLERLFDGISYGYRYFRKRSKEAKSSYHNITMRHLALRYFVCEKNVPHEGVGGDVEELFDEKGKYNRIFDENAISKDLNANHVAIKYVTVWNIDQLLQKMKSDLPKRDAKLHQYTRWFVLSDIYGKLRKWKQKSFNLGWKAWVDFLESSQFAKAVSDYARYAFRVAAEVVPEDEDARLFLKKAMATDRFNSVIRVREFQSAINRAFKSFEKTI